MALPAGLVHDPIKHSIAQSIKFLVDEALASAQIDPTQLAKNINLHELLERPPQPEMGDYAFPCFALAKLLRKNPHAIATTFAAALQAQPEKSGSDQWIERATAVGAFLNVFVNKAQLANLVINKSLDLSLFRPSPRLEGEKRVMIEFSQPNTHKEFHVGHGRNVCLGDAMCQIFRANGYDVVGVNYIGDEGTHVAKCLWQIERSGEALPTVNQGEWYGRMYSEANLALSDEKASGSRTYNDEVSKILTALEKKEGHYFDLWQTTRKNCLDDFDRTYEWLNIKFDHVFFESDVSQESQEIVDEFIEKGLFITSEGAYGIDMSQWNLGFFMVRKSDGTSLYITKDLALARRKFGDFNIDRSIYVVGSEQNYHFNQLFKALELMGFKQAKQCHHLNYAHVRLPDGKMSSRKGTAVTFKQLIDLTTIELGHYLAKYAQEWSEEDIADTGHKLAVAAIKYGMLMADPSKEIIFDPKAWTSFEGHSGPYLCYTYARSRSIMRKGHGKGIATTTDSLNRLTDPVEHEILRCIYDLNHATRVACEQYKPSVICTYLYDLCKTFNRFYANVPVLTDECAETRNARLTLTVAVGNSIKHGLKLIGITPPERM